MKITVIGTINKDLIMPFNGRPIECFGGIFYDVSVLSQLLEEEHQIVPVSYVGDDVYDTLCAIMRKLPNVSLDGLLRIPEKNHKVRGFCINHLYGCRDNLLTIYSQANQRTL